MNLNAKEVNIIVSKKLLVGDSKSKCINVVKGEPFGIYDEKSSGVPKDSVEVTFDLIQMNKDVEIKTRVGDSFGIHVNEPYPHFLINSHIDYDIQEDFVKKPEDLLGIQSVLIDNTKAFKLFYSPNFKITIEKNYHLWTIVMATPTLGLELGQVITN